MTVATLTPPASDVRSRLSASCYVAGVQRILMPGAHPRGPLQVARQSAHRCIWVVQADTGDERRLHIIQSVVPHVCPIQLRCCASCVYAAIAVRCQPDRTLRKTAACPHVSGLRSRLLQRYAPSDAARGVCNGYDEQFKYSRAGSCMSGSGYTGLTGLGERSVCVMFIVQINLLDGRAGAGACTCVSTDANICSAAARCPATELRAITQASCRV